MIGSGQGVTRTRRLLIGPVLLLPSRAGFFVSLCGDGAPLTNGGWHLHSKPIHGVLDAASVSSRAWVDEPAIKVSRDHVTIAELDQPGTCCACRRRSCSALSASNTS
jgi:hypothetical protein